MAPNEPSYYILHVEDLVSVFLQEWRTAIAVKLDQASIYHPDVSYLMTRIIEAIKDERDIELNLAMMAFNDIMTMTHVEVVCHGQAMFSDLTQPIHYHAHKKVVLEQYSDLHVQLANITKKFGNNLIERLRVFGIYRGGYFPYHYAGWMGENILVEQDEILQQTIPDNLFAKMENVDDEAR